MIRRLAKSVREFKKPAILTLIFIVLEAVIETFIPFTTAAMVERIEAGVDIGEIIRLGLLLILMAILSLACGGAAGYTCAKASAGFSRNLRYDLFSKIQTFSFKNIDKFSTSSLITRLTTDVGQVQMSFMMIIRIAVRAPLMLIFSIIMTFVMGGQLAWAFIAITIPLSIGLVLIARFALPTFRRVFKKYDKMNESIEENVRGMRVVKGFAREEYEKQKFDAASDAIRRDFTKAERIVAWNSPLMQFCVYANMIVIMFIGSKLVISSGGTVMNVETMSALLTYGMQILMQFMMLSMIYVILTISAESARRINEVLSEEPTLKNPENPVMTVADGSIDFENVGF
ncbi:MAG: ABC transporter ATP-binding protein [Clostridia bacterium]|nr:ABC transporter ATP-binding protein [Clostridia bacterium]